MYRILKDTFPQVVNFRVFWFWLIRSFVQLKIFSFYDVAVTFLDNVIVASSNINIVLLPSKSTCLCRVPDTSYV